MKKLTTLLAAFLFTAGMAFTQNNDATVDQTGNNQEATVDQVGSTNTADVDQFTDNGGVQAATVDQNGMGNSATVDQSQTGTGGISPSNTAFIQQIGTDNTSVQTTTAPGFNQGQNVRGYQEGNENMLTQTISAGWGIGLEADQYGDKNEATQLADRTGNLTGIIVQDGELNEAFQDISGLNNRAEIMQEGDGNYATQTTKGFGPAAWITSFTLIEQLGNDNHAEQTLDGDGVRNEITLKIFQDGDMNRAYQTATGNGHASTITQNGNSNMATVTQSN